MRSYRLHARVLSLWTLVLVAACGGCHQMPYHDKFGDPHHEILPVGGDIPRELSKVQLPTYVIQPPDILVVEAMQAIPKQPYSLHIFDKLYISVEGTFEDKPIEGEYAILPGGLVNLGQIYGSVKVEGLSVDQAKAAIEAHLKTILKQPVAYVTLTEFAGKQQIAGEHLVGIDGTIQLGIYGSVSVVGMTLAEAKTVIERHLTQYLDKPEVAVDVYAYNSMVYYLITEGAGLGDTVTKFPITGNETVLDAIANVSGLTEVSSKRIWIARPSTEAGDVQILPVDWKAVSGLASTATNYQIMPGDRIFVAQDSMVAFDNSLGKILAPVERIMGFSILGVTTLGRFSGRVLQNTAGRGGGTGGF